MIAVSCLAGRTVAVFGLGRSGLVTAKAIDAGGGTVLCWDDNEKGVETARAEGFRCEDLRTVDWAALDALILAPGVPLTDPEPHWSVQLAHTHDVEIIGDIELFFREKGAQNWTAPVVAITGTNGKSTTTALIHHMLTSGGFEAQVGGNIGTAVLALDPPQDKGAFVLECSSYQIDLAPSLHADFGILLNVSPDHIDRHGTFENYAHVKERLVAKSKVAIVGVDDAASLAIADRRASSGKPMMPLSTLKKIEDGIYWDAGTLARVEKGKTVSEINLGDAANLRGQHNGENAAAAFAVGSQLGLSDEAISQAYRSFSGLAHRMQIIAQKDHVLFVNDSKATNADAAKRALRSFSRIYWITGGRAKDGGIDDLLSELETVVTAYLIGESTPDFARALEGHVPFAMCETIERAVHEAYQTAKKDESGGECVVLLSPSAASFDQFANFEIRGQAFCDAVERLLLNGLTVE